MLSVQDGESVTAEKSELLKSSGKNQTQKNENGKYILKNGKWINKCFAFRNIWRINGCQNEAYTQQHCFNF